MKMGSFVMQEDSFVAESANDVPNVLMIRVLVLLIFTATGNSVNGVSSIIVMVMFNYLKINFSATKNNFEKLLARGGARG